jgi:hypothetical protein
MALVVTTVSSIVFASHNNWLTGFFIAAPPGILEGSCAAIVGHRAAVFFSMCRRIFVVMPSCLFIVPPCFRLRAVMFR